MNFAARISEALSIPEDALFRIVGTVAILVAWIVIGRLGRRLIARAVDEPASRFQMSRVMAYVLGATALVLLTRIWVQGVTGIATYLGLLSAGVAIALQDPLTNLAGWLFIIIRRPFRIGDRIQIGPHAGDVVDIRPFRFVMLEIGNWVNADQGTGRVLHVPNGLVFKNTVANYDEAFGYIWNELELTITFESDWRAAKAALQQILDEHAEKTDAQVRKRVEEASHVLNIKVPTATPAVWTSIVENGVRLTMRYLCKPRTRRSSAAQIWEQVLDKFAAMPNVAFAYPTTRRFDNLTEGKPALRAAAASADRGDAKIEADAEGR